MPTFQVLGMLFGISKTEANDAFHYWIPILRDVLPASLLEQVSNNESNLLFVQEVLMNFRLLVDSLEQPIYRHFDQKEQQKYFSGKKRQHTLKSQMIGMPEGKDIKDGSLPKQEQNVKETPCTTGSEIMSQIFDACGQHGLELLDDGIYRNDVKLGKVGFTNGNWCVIRTAPAHQGRVNGQV
nr:transposase family protein [Nostoc sp. FACHB-280]